MKKIVMTSVIAAAFSIALSGCSMLGSLTGKTATEPVDTTKSGSAYISSEDEFGNGNRTEISYWYK